MCPCERTEWSGSSARRGSRRWPDRSRTLSIGKFDILATYAYARALLDGLSEPEAKERGIVAAIMGAEARLGHGGDHKAEKEAAEKKKRTMITAKSFDRQVADEMGPFVGDVFLPSPKRLAEAGLSNEDVKRAVRIPGTWGEDHRGAVPGACRRPAEAEALRSRPTAATASARRGRRRYAPRSHAFSSWPGPPNPRPIISIAVLM